MKIDLDEHNILTIEVEYEPYMLGSKHHFVLNKQDLISLYEQLYPHLETYYNADLSRIKQEIE